MKNLVLKYGYLFFLAIALAEALTAAYTGYTRISEKDTLGKTAEYLFLWSEELRHWNNFWMFLFIGAGWKYFKKETRG